MLIIRVVAVMLLSIPMLTRAESPALLPPWGVALGMLLGFAHAARAYEAECSPHVGSARVQETLGPWFARNQGLIDQVRSVARKSKWGLSDLPNPEAWDRLEQQNISIVRLQVVDKLRGDPKSFCYDALLSYKNGTNELRNFPVHLKVLGIDAP